MGLVARYWVQISVPAANKSECTSRFLYKTHGYLFKIADYYSS